MAFTPPKLEEEKLAVHTERYGISYVKFKELVTSSNELFDKVNISWITRKLKKDRPTLDRKTVKGWHTILQKEDK